MSIQDKLTKQKGLVFNVYTQYLGTIVSGFLMFITIVIFNHCSKSSSIPYDMVERLIYIFMIAAVGCLFAESLALYIKDERRKIYRITGVAIASIMALVWEIILDNFVDNVTTVGEEIILRFFVMYMIAGLALAIYLIIKNTELSFQGFLRTSVKNLLKMIFTFGLVNVGILFILLLFNLLIASVDIWDMILDAELILSGVIYVPYAIICITDNNEKSSKFFANVVRYVLMPLLCAATVIIYMYIIKILLGNKISNSIFYPCAITFFIGVPIWEMARIEKEKKNFYDKIIFNMHYIYAPFILLEIYSMATRIGRYGFTFARYMAVMFIILQIIYVAWDLLMKLLKKEAGKEKIILVVIAMAVVSLLVPFINAFYIPYLSQRHRFTNSYPIVKDIAYQNVNELTEEQWKKIDDFRGSYLMLTQDVRGTSFLDKRYNANELDEIRGSINKKHKHSSSTDVVKTDKGQYYSMYYNNNEKPMDISGGYTKLWDSNNHYAYEAEYSLDELKEFIIEYGDGQEIEVDISHIMMDIVDDDNFGKIDQPYVVTGNNKIVFEKISFSYNEDTQKFTEISVYGQILTK